MVRLHTELRNIESKPFPVKQPHHNAFAFHHRDGGHPDVQEYGCNFGTELPVLGQSLLCYVQGGKQFYP